MCLAQIRDTDTVFAWIDRAKARFANDEDIPPNYLYDPSDDADPTCFGTLYELGYAAALNKEIVIASSGRLPSSIWFTYTGATFVTAPTPREAFEHAFRPKPVSISAKASPIERQFAEAWLRIGTSISLASQHSVGPYSIDFAHVASRTAIELDGFASHSSTADIENDRKRQRFIEDAGWNVIRFGGREVHHDAVGVVQAVLARIEQRSR